MASRTSTPNSRKADARKYQREHGVSYQQALAEVKPPVESSSAIEVARRIVHARPDSGMTFVVGKQPVVSSYIGELLLHLAELGVVPIDKAVHTRRSDLVGAHEGEPSKRVNDAVKSALGGALILHDVHDLNRGNPAGPDMFGAEAAYALLVAVVNHQRDDLIVIAGGDPSATSTFLSKHEGWRSRIDQWVSV